jgi:hypothetical protein
MRGTNTLALVNYGNKRFNRSGHGHDGSLTQTQKRTDKPDKLTRPTKRKNANGSSVTRLGDILLFGYFLLGQYLHFWLNKQLQNMVCCTYFNNQKELGVDVFDFQLELEYFGYSLGYISKYWANFCSIFWSLWPEETCLGAWAIIFYPSLIFPGQTGSSTRVSSSLECKY